MPVATPANIAVETIHGTHLTLGGLIETFLQSLTAGTEIFSISVVKQAVGNNFTATIAYESPP